MEPEWITALHTQIRSIVAGLDEWPVNVQTNPTSNSLLSDSMHPRSDENQATHVETRIGVPVKDIIAGEAPKFPLRPCDIVVVPTYQLHP